MPGTQRRRSGKGVRPRRNSSGSAWRAGLVFAVLTLVLASLLLVVVMAGGTDGGSGGIVPGDGPTVEPSPTPTDTSGTGREIPTPTEGTTPVPTFGTDLPCGDILVPVDKARRLPADCEPPDLVLLPERMSYVIDLPILLRADAASALEEMLDAAADAGLVIVVRSAYRSFDDQARTYEANVAAGGQEYADRSSARAGHSEHQLGTTADLTSESNAYGLEGFESTPEGRWVAENAARFGFVITYPEGAEAITGYIYEPWHVRYVGREVAAAIDASGLVPVQYLEGAR